jgi:hypothetical protein
MRTTAEIIGLLIALFGAYVAYRFGLKSKKHDLIMKIITEIREEASRHTAELIDSSNRLSFMNSKQNFLLNKIEIIMDRNGHVLNWWKKRKIIKAINKIQELYKTIANDKHPTDNKYRKPFYKILDSIKIYD